MLLYPSPGARQGQRAPPHRPFPDGVFWGPLKGSTRCPICPDSDDLSRWSSQKQKMVALSLSLMYHGGVQSFAERLFSLMNILATFCCCPPDLLFHSTQSTIYTQGLGEIHFGLWVYIHPIWDFLLLF